MTLETQSISLKCFNSRHDIKARMIHHHTAYSMHAKINGGNSSILLNIKNTNNSTMNVQFSVTGCCPYQIHCKT